MSNYIFIWWQYLSSIHRSEIKTKSIMIEYILPSKERKRICHRIVDRRWRSFIVHRCHLTKYWSCSTHNSILIAWKMIKSKRNAICQSKFHIFNAKKFIKKWSFVEKIDLNSDYEEKENWSQIPSAKVRSNFKWFDQWQGSTIENET